GKVGLYVTEDDLDQYFHIDYEATSFVPGESSRPDDEDSESTSASGDAQADADFSELMKSMGLSEDELRLDADVDDAADDAAADDGQTSIDDFLDAEDEDDSDGGENQR
ncbi:MAG: bifunctional nuclease family protein, partial [Corynebacterium casei]|nr:bifunctional nuclease family protein [Corynebacterium casei]